MGGIPHHEPRLGEEALRFAVKILGGIRRTAERLDLAPTSVSLWFSRGTVSAERACDLERLTNGRVARWQIRPDLYDGMPGFEDLSGDNAAYYLKLASDQRLPIYRWPQDRHIAEAELPQRPPGRPARYKQDAMAKQKNIRQTRLKASK